MIASIILMGISFASVVNIADYGATPNSRMDATAAVASAIQALKPGGVLRFPAGEFHFFRNNAQERELYLSNTDVSNPRRVAIALENLRDIQVQGTSDTRLVFHGRVMPFLIDHCRNISLKNLQIDWERPLMSQFDVIASDPQGVTLRTDTKEFPYAVRNGKLVFLVEDEERRNASWMEFDPVTRGVAYNTGDRGCMGGDAGSAKGSEIAPGTIRLDYPANNNRPKIGHKLIARHGIRDHAGTFIQESQGIRIENVAYRHTSGLGVLAQRSEDLTFRQVEFKPDRSSKRLFSGHDDGFHISNCKGQVTIENCTFEGLMDDPINVHGTSVRAIRQENSRTWLIRFMHHQSQGFPFGDVGDTVSFVSGPTMESFGRAKIAKIDRLTTAEARITFDRETPKEFREGDAVENLTWTPEATIRNNTFGTVRARGLLISTPRKVKIEGNLFKSSGSAILIAGDANGWYESGAVTDVLIQKNLFENCLTSDYQFCEGIISIDPEIPKEGGPAFHRNIRILDNTFLTFQNSVLWAKSVDGLEFSRNRIKGSRSYVPWHPTKEGFTFIDCQNVRVTGNQIESGFGGRAVSVIRGKPKTIKVQDWN
ncbi:MAG: right-handed parallel beta-helix repeat-containing protein [Armatimonadetes bacterium]|nr:right-handed parallel beta-helix repeat-containing protein [Armatimonadota bacterium]